MQIFERSVQSLVELHDWIQIGFTDVSPEPVGIWSGALQLQFFSQGRDFEQGQPGSGAQPGIALATARPKPR
jgi:hypothetical protein